MSSISKVLVSIINWNNNSATSACLESIAKIPKSRQPHIRLIDNNSREEPLNIGKNILLKLNNIEVINNKSNIGFAKAHNQSIKIALDNNYDFVCLLNNDTTVEDEKLFEKLTEPLKDNLSLASAPTILDDDGRIWYAGGSFSRSSSSPSHVRVGETPKNLGNTRQTDHITGCCLMINLRADNPYLPDEYFMYWEDAEFSARAHKNNQKLFYVPDATITHNVSSSLGLQSPTYIYYIIRNNVLFIKRNTSWHNKPLSYLKVMSIDAKYEIKALLSGWGQFKQTEKALLQAWKDGLKNRGGKMKSKND